MIWVSKLLKKVMKIPLPSLSLMSVFCDFLLVKLPVPLFAYSFRSLWNILCHLWVLCQFSATFFTCLTHSSALHVRLLWSSHHNHPDLLLPYQVPSSRSRKPRIWEGTDREIHMNLQIGNLSITFPSWCIHQVWSGRLEAELAAEMSKEPTEISIWTCKLAIHRLHSLHEVFIKSDQGTVRQNSKLRGL